MEEKPEKGQGAFCTLPRGCWRPARGTKEVLEQGPKWLREVFGERMNHKRGNKKNKKNKEKVLSTLAKTIRYWRHRLRPLSSPGSGAGWAGPGALLQCWAAKVMREHGVTRDHSTQLEWRPPRGRAGNPNLGRVSQLAGACTWYLFHYPNAALRHQFRLSARDWSGLPRYYLGM